MLLFAACIIILWLWTVLQKRHPGKFGKEKVFPLKGILAVLIVLHHLTYEINSTLLQYFHSWGAPVVSVFFFISGYGLMASYKNKGRQYLTGFIKHRMFDAVILPFLLALLLYRCMATELPNVADAISLLVTKGTTTLPNSWFVFAILIFYLLFYLSCKIREGKTILSPLILSGITYSIIIRWLGYDRCWYISALAFPAGCFFAYHWQAFLNLSFRWRIWVIPICLTLVSVLYLLHQEVGYMLIYVLIPLMVIYLCSSLSIERLGRTKFVRLLSKISYEIYLCHGIAIFLLHKTEQIQLSSIYVLSVFLLTFIFAFIVKQATKFLVAHGI